MMQQTESDVRVAGRTPDNIRMITMLIDMQIDMQMDDRFHAAAQGRAATNAYVGYPGHGEVLVGAGMQSRHAAGDSLRFFGPLLAGPNLHGVVLKPQVGVNWSLGERLALHAQAGRTIGIGSHGQSATKERFRANGMGAGSTCRFSLPGG